MLWSTKDEGGEIQAWRVDSFENSNQRDVQIALCVTDVYPMKDLNVFLDKLNEIKNKYPETKPLCEHWIISTNNALLREKTKNKGSFQEAKQTIVGFLNNYIQNFKT